MFEPSLLLVEEANELTLFAKKKNMSISNKQLKQPLYKANTLSKTSPLEFNPPLYKATPSGGWRGKKLSRATDSKADARRALVVKTKQIEIIIF